jgi:hypothetical protein
MNRPIDRHTDGQTSKSRDEKWKDSWTDEMKDGHTDKQMKGKRKTVE